MLYAAFYGVVFRISTYLIHQFPQISVSEIFFLSIHALYKLRNICDLTDKSLATTVKL